MRIARYQAATMQDALRQVQGELGADAMILRTRTLAPKLPLLGRHRVEVVAAVAEDPAGAPAAGVEETSDRLTLEAERPAGGPTASERASAEANGHAQPADRSPNTPPLSPEAPADLGAELAAIRRALAGLAAWAAPRLDVPAGVAVHLVEVGVSPALARELAAAAEGVGPAQAWAAVAAAIRGRLRVSGPIRLEPEGAFAEGNGGARPSARPRVVALVGPTGAGKSTTLAKLAAHYAIAARRRVGLLSLDTFRVGAFEQMRIYAEVLDVPLLAADCPAAAATALDRFSDRELILVDTVGHAPGDGPRLSELARLLAAADPDEVHLVLAAPTERRSLLAAVEGFRRLAPSHLLLSKLDEAYALGGVVEVAIRAGLPLSYFSQGQDVPEQIVPAAAEALAAAVCPEEAA